MRDACPQCGWKEPRRLTATPSDVVVWVQEKEGGGTEMLLRPRKTEENKEAARGVRDGWARLDRKQWETFRGCVDSYFRALDTLESS